MFTARLLALLGAMTAVAVLAVLIAVHRRNCNGCSTCRRFYIGIFGALGGAGIAVGPGVIWIGVQ
jgi:hypothetical protein